MNIRRRQKAEHSKYVAKMRTKLKSLPSDANISTKMPRAEVDEICTDELRLCIEKLLEQAKNHKNPNAHFFITEFEKLMEKLQNATNMCELFNEFRHLRRRWFAYSRLGL